MTKPKNTKIFLFWGNPMDIIAEAPRIGIFLSLTWGPYMRDIYELTFNPLPSMGPVERAYILGKARATLTAGNATRD